MKSVVYTSTPKLVSDASSHAAILPAKSTSAEDTTPVTPAGKATTKPAKAAHGFHTRLADKAVVEPTNEVDIKTHGRAAGQSTTEVGMRSPEQPREYIPAVRAAFKSASSSAKQATTSEAAGKQPLASNTEVSVSFQLQLINRLFAAYT